MSFTPCLFPTVLRARPLGAATRTIAAAALCAGIFYAGGRSYAETGSIQLPPPALQEAQPAAPQTIVLAGGCFWGVQGVFEHVKGVESAVAGYSGGAAATAHYETVSGGDTGHAESVKITYDPRTVSLGKLLQIFFSVTADPTELDRQGPDTGTQYRSAIFPTTPEQSKIAAAYIAQLDKSGVYHDPIVTKIETFKGFFPAEGYHQNYLTRHPTNPYILINDIPKVQGLKKLFSHEYKADPTLVAAAD